MKLTKAFLSRIIQFRQSILIDYQLIIFAVALTNTVDNMLFHTISVSFLYFIMVKESISGQIFQRFSSRFVSSGNPIEIE